MKLHPRQLSRFVGAGIILRASKVLLQLFALAVLTRLLSIDEFGAYAFVIVLVQVLSIPTQFGLPQLIVRETVSLASSGDTGGLRQLQRWASRNVLFASALAIPCGALFLLSGFGPAISVLDVVLGLILIPLLGLGNLRSSQLRALGRGVFSQFAELFISPALFLLFLLTALLTELPFQIGLAAVLGMRAVSAAIALVAAHVVLMRFSPDFGTSRSGEEKHTHDRLKLSGERRKATIMLGISASIYALNGNLDILMLGNLRGEEETALYRIATVTAGSVAILMQSLNSAAGPMLAYGVKQGQAAHVESLVSSLIRKLQILLIPMVLFMVFAGQWAIPFAFGVTYTPSYDIMLILLLAGCLNIWFGPAGLLLNMSGHDQPVLWASLVSLALNLLLNLLLIPPYGAAGAATATVLATFFWNVQLWWFAKRRTGINTLHWLGPRH